MTADLHDRLGELAALAPDPKLDLPLVSAEARRRVRRRQLAVAGPAAALLVMAPLAWAAAGLDGDRLVQQPADRAPAAGPPLASLQAAVTAEVDFGGEQPRLSAVVADGPVSLGTELPGVGVTFSSLTDKAESFVPFPYWDTEAVAADSSGVLAVGGGCAPGWAPSGQRRDSERCGGALIISEAPPGVPIPSRLALYPRVGDRQALPGTYRTSLDLRDGGTLVLTITVTEQEPAAPVTSVPADEVVQYAVSYDSVQAYETHQEAVRRCLTLPGAVPGDTAEPYPPIHYVTVTGAQENEAFQDCTAALNGVTASIQSTSTTNDLGVPPPILTPGQLPILSATREGEELVLSLDTCGATDVQATAIIEPGAVRIIVTGNDVEDGNLCADVVRVLLPLGARSLPLLDAAGNPIEIR